MELQNKIKNCMGSMRILIHEDKPFVVNQNKINVTDSDMTLNEWVDMYNKTAKESIKKSELDLSNFNAYIV